MCVITSVEFDDCRKWIRKKRNKGTTWNELNYACKENEEGLRTFLEIRKDEDDWPIQLNPDVWKKLIEDVRHTEESRVRILEKRRIAELHDNQTETNRISVPQGERSSWQLYKKHLKENKRFSDDAIDKIEHASEEILKRLSPDTTHTGPIKGLVVGNVQSGKTANMAGLMAMAADWGWNMFIVLSGTIESLRKQTQNRLHGDLNHAGNLVWTQFDHLSRKKSPIGQRLCDLQLQPTSPMRYMTVCLKVKSRLQDLIEWIEQDQNNIRNLKVLVIDDEADQAGVSTGDVYTPSERKTINRLILNLVHCRNKEAINSETNTYTGNYEAMNYISYTATPYANCLNETGIETLYPKNFIKTLDVANGYFGPDKFFDVSDADMPEHMNIVRTVPEGDINKIKSIQKNRSGKIPVSMQSAILWFICAASVMRYYNYKNPVSMLIHTSQKQQDHAAIAEAVLNWITKEKNSIIEKCEQIYKYEVSQFTKKQLRKAYPEYEHSDEDIWNYPEFEDIKKYIKELTQSVSSIMMDEEGELQYNRGIHICVDNCSNTGVTDEGMHVRLAYPDETLRNKPDFSTAFIVIGGNTLSRGLTLEGLVSTFFLRSVKQADTLMQMGRWFGYRPSYELLQRVWLSEDTIRKFELLADVDQDLREQIYQMQIAGKGPEDFNLTLLQSPKVSWLSLTAKNKMQMAIPAKIDFSGMDTQLTVYSKDPIDQMNNIQVTKQFISQLGKGRKSENMKAYIWENVDYKYIEKEFFGKKFSIAETSRAFQQIELLNDWIDIQTKKGAMENWTIVVCGTKVQKDMPDEKKWILPNGEIIGKVNRSCKSDSSDRVNIGILSGKKDYLADIRKDMIDEKLWDEMITCRNMGNRYKEFRKAAGVEKKPLFLIYMIDKNSKPRQGDSRMPLKMAHDLIGITMVTPGVRGTGGTETRLKIKPINYEDQEVEEE